MTISIVNAIIFKETQKVWRIAKNEDYDNLFVNTTQKNKELFLYPNDESKRVKDIQTWMVTIFFPTRSELPQKNLVACIGVFAHNYLGNYFHGDLIQ